MSDSNQTITIDTEETKLISKLATTLNNIEQNLSLYLAQQKSLNEKATENNNDSRLVIKQYEDIADKMVHNLGNLVATVVEKIKDLDLNVYALRKLPEKINEDLIKLAPEIGEKVALQHTESLQYTKYLEKFTQHINLCESALKQVKANAEHYYQWKHKKTAIIVGIAAVIATLASTVTTYVIFKNNPPRHETRILKADNVRADNTVHIFDMTGKFCGRAIIPPEKK